MRCTPCSFPLILISAYQVGIVCFVSRTRKGFTMTDSVPSPANGNSNGTADGTVPAENDTAASGTTADGKGFAGYSDPGSITVAAIETAWRAVQQRNPDVPDVVVVAGTGANYRKNTVLWGHFHADQWNTDSGTRHELLISGECLSQGARHVFETVLHEAVHAVNHERGIKDTSRGGQYHNKRFVNTAQELGMVWPDDSTPHGTRGFSAVRMTEETAAHYADTLSVLENGRAAWRELVVPDTPADGTDVDDNGDGDDAADDKPTRKRSRNTKPKAECECGPDKAIWASRRVLSALSVYCGDCRSGYLIVEPHDG